MPNSIAGSLEIEEAMLFKWGSKLLYVLLFISCMVAMGYWHLPTTFPFLAAVFCFIFPQLFRKKEEIESDETNIQLKKEEEVPQDSLLALLHLKA